MDNDSSGLSSSLPAKVTVINSSSLNVTSRSVASGGSFTGSTDNVTVAISDDNSPSLAL